MSIEALAAVMESGLHKGAEFSVLVALASMANPDGTCSPSNAHLANVARISTETLGRALRALELDGAIARTTAGQRRHRVIRIDLERYRAAARAARMARKGG